MKFLEAPLQRSVIDIDGFSWQNTKPDPSQTQRWPFESTVNCKPSPKEAGCLFLGLRHETWALI